MFLSRFHVAFLAFLLSLDSMSLLSAEVALVSCVFHLCSVVVAFFSRLSLASAYFLVGVSYFPFAAVAVPLLVVCCSLCCFSVAALRGLVPFPLDTNSLVYDPFSPA